MQRPHGHGADCSLLADPGHHPVDRHGLLMQCRLYVPERGLEATRLSHGGRRSRYRVVGFEGLVPFEQGSVTGDSFGGFLLLPEWCLQKNIKCLTRFTGRRKGGAAGRVVFCWRFKGGQLEDIRGDWAVWRFDRQKIQTGGSSWFCVKLCAPLLCWQHVFVMCSAALQTVDSERHRGPCSPQHVGVERPLQVCMWKRRWNVTNIRDYSIPLWRKNTTTQNTSIKM